MNPVVFTYSSSWYLARTCTSVGADPKRLCLIMTKVVFGYDSNPFFFVWLNVDINMVCIFLMVCIEV